MTSEIINADTSPDTLDSGTNAAGSEYEVKLKISSNARKKLPENFNIQEIGRIDLTEAEAIANEDILFLTENDLIEGLEDFDLIPLNDDVQHQPIQDAEIKTGIKKSEAEVRPEPESAPVINDKNNIDEKNQRETEAFSVAEEKIQENDDTDLLDFISSEDKTPEEFKPRDIIHPEQEKNVNEQDLLDAEVDLNKLKSSFGNLPADDTLDENDESSDLEPSMTDAVSTNIKILSRKDEVELIDDFDNSNMQSSSDSYTDTADSAAYNKIKSPIEKEKLPEWVYALESSSDKTYFIDDEIVENDKRSAVLNFEERELEKITSRIIETFEIKPRVLIEADIEDDKENIAYTSSGIAPAFDDLLLDFEDDELKYRDDDLDFIHSAIIEEDYSKYLRLIDDYHGLSGERKVTAAVELLGLTNDELDEMGDSLFANDYKGINLDEAFSLIKNQSALNYKDTGKNITCTYLLSDPESLLLEEKRSIESDISSAFALIYEEDVEQLKSHLKEIFVETKADSVKIVEEIYDITDRVVIIEDETDMKRFVKDEIPEHKRDDLVRLMKYLDGMFEKLPETAVKNFADSEYFNLYVKILNDLGV